MRQLRTAGLLLLCFVFTPGLAELCSDALHLSVEGHSYHAEGHEEPGPEHGCNGWHHTCSCCQALSIAPAAAPSVDVAPPLTAPAELLAFECERGPCGVRDVLDRPPQA